MKVISWNVRRATAKSVVWDYLLEADPDIALLQEVGSVPAAVAERYHQLTKTAVTKAGLPQRFQTTILSKLPIIAEIGVHTSSAWVQEQAEFFQGNLVGAKLQGDADQPLYVMNVYSPAWEIVRTKWQGLDVSNLKLTANPDIWCTEILWDLLKHSMPSQPGQWIVGGDFNSSETLDFTSRGDRGNREIMARLAGLGFTEMLRGHRGCLVPTYKSIQSKRLIHQLDHLYVTAPLSERLAHCDVGDVDAIIWGGLSDHLPIIAKFAESSLHLRGAHNAASV